MNQGAVALITGGNRGLGRATAVSLALSGVDVIITYRSNKDEAEAVVGSIEAVGRKAVALRLDTTGFDSLPAFADSVRHKLANEWGRDSFDFLVNNAGNVSPTPIGGLELPPGEEPRTRDHREHHDLVDLIAAGDAAGARSLMSAHIERSLTGSAIDALEDRERHPAGEAESEAS